MTPPLPSDERGSTGIEGRPRQRRRRRDDGGDSDKEGPSRCNAGNTLPSVSASDESRAQCGIIPPPSSSSPPPQSQAAVAMPAVATTTTAPGPNDVLNGRGSGVQYHVGNVRYRKLVFLHREIYVACPRGDKPKIATAIVSAVRSRGGRFLEQTGGGASSDSSSSSVWTDIGDAKAVDKTKQALRDCQPPKGGSGGGNKVADVPSIAPPLLEASIADGATPQEAKAAGTLAAAAASAGAGKAATKSSKPVRGTASRKLPPEAYLGYSMQVLDSLLAQEKKDDADLGIGGGDDRTMASPVARRGASIPSSDGASNDSHGAVNEMAMEGPMNDVGGSSADAEVPSTGGHMNDVGDRAYAAGSTIDAMTPDGTERDAPAAIAPGGTKEEDQRAQRRRTELFVPAIELDVARQRRSSHLSGMSRRRSTRSSCSSRRGSAFDALAAAFGTTTRTQDRSSFVSLLSMEIDGLMNDFANELDDIEMEGNCDAFEASHSGAGGNDGASLDGQRHGVTFQQGEREEEGGEGDGDGQGRLRRRRAFPIRGSILRRNDAGLPTVIGCDASADAAVSNMSLMSINEEPNDLENREFDVSAVEDLLEGASPSNELRCPIPDPSLRTSARTSFSADIDQIYREFQGSKNSLRSSFSVDMSEFDREFDDALSSAFVDGDG